MYLQQAGLELPCAVEPQQHALLDAKLRAFVNHEVYFFSNQRARRRFLKDPPRYCGLLTDPVSRRRFKPAPGSPHLEYQERWFYFSSDSTRTAFQAAPDSFALRRGM